jgi:hypothetical protein
MTETANTSSFMVKRQPKSCVAVKTPKDNEEWDKNVRDLEVEIKILTAVNERRWAWPDDHIIRMLAQSVISQFYSLIFFNVFYIH